MKKFIYLLLIIPLIFTSCKKEEGCTDSLATNYNSSAEEDDGSCIYSILGVWHLTGWTIDGLDAMPSVVNGTFEFFNDNSALYEIDFLVSSSLTIVNTWTLSGTTLTLVDDNDLTDITTWEVTKLDGTQLHMIGDVEGAENITQWTKGSN